QPEIDVQGQGVSIPSGSTTPQASDGTDFGSAVVMGMAVTRTFTILNTGTDDLLLSGMPAVVLNGDPDFSVTVQPSSTVAPAASTTFEITFTPQSLGARTVTVQIENNDPDESPYTFVVGGAGTAAPEPEIDVTGNGTPIPSGSTVPTIDNGTEFGKAEVGTTSVTRTYAIQNLGSTALTLGTVTLSGDADFAVTSQPQATLAPGESTTLDVTFTPMMAGLRAATVEIPNNDADENPYTFAIQGTGTVAAPEIEVSGLGQPIASGSTMPEVGNGTDFGTTTAGSMPLTRTFTIANQGTAPLNLTGMPLVELSGDPVFTVTAEPTTPVQPTGSTTFVIEFAPTDAGTFSATVSIANDDADENPYTFAITGTATASNQPEIAVAGNGIEIVSGDSTPDAADGTDFGEVELGSSRVQSFTISNTGSAPLTLTADPPVAVTGTEFVVVTPPQTQIAAGESTTFQIEFTPVTAGRVTETVTIESDDSDEGSYVFTLAGTGVEPQGGTCGDGVVDAGEACDDGNTASGDGCAGDCSAIDDGWYCEIEGMACTTSCGDGIVAGSEVCDDGAGNSDTQAGACRSDCSGVVPGQKKEEPGCGCGAAGGGSGGWVFALSAFGLALSRRRRRCP
ncbi:MAG: choice-of-anchor D domain-containing protein, partial [Deltaproteobacteria bacterium]